MDVDSPLSLVGINGVPLNSRHSQQTVIRSGDRDLACIGIAHVGGLQRVTASIHYRIIRGSKVSLAQAYVVLSGGKLEPAEQLLVTMLPLDFNMGAVL